MADRKQAKQRRQAQNRARRAEIAARSEAAQRKASAGTDAGSVGSRPARTAGAVSQATGKGGPRARATGAAGGAGGLLSGRPRVERGGLLGRFGWNEPGGQAVILGAAATVLASIALCFVKIIPVDGPWEVTDRAAQAAAAGPITAGQRAEILSHAKVHSETLLKNLGSRGWLFLAMPIVLTWLTVLIARPANRKRTWVMGAIALFLFVFIYQQLGIFYIVPFGLFAWGAYQAYKAARLERMAETAAAAPISTTGRDAGGTGDGADADGSETETANAAGGPRPSLLSSLFKPQPRVTRSAGRPTGAAGTKRNPTRSPGRPRRSTGNGTTAGNGGADGDTDDA